MPSTIPLSPQPAVPNIVGDPPIFSDPVQAHSNGQNHDREVDIVDSPMPDYVDEHDLAVAPAQTEGSVATSQLIDPVIEKPRPEDTTTTVTTPNSTLFNRPLNDLKVLDDPAYSVGATSGFDWKISNFSSLRGSRNLEKACLSSPVQIGGSSWQLKLYANGFSSDFLGIYLQCCDFLVGSNDAPKATAASPTNPDLNIEYVEPVLPLFGDDRILKRRRVAAQFRITMFNPDDTRINFMSNEINGDFSMRNMDRGFSRFGPWRVDELKSPQPRSHHRSWPDLNGSVKAAPSSKTSQRAMLENDSLAFHVQIRVIEDPTGHLWESPYPGDSYAIHGFRGLRCEGGTSLISAVASWLLLAPFRKIMYDVQVPEPSQRPMVRPMKLVEAFQRILYLSRCSPGNATIDSVALDFVRKAIQWHGDLLPYDDETDVFRIWDVLKRFLEIELHGTEHERALNRLFDGGRRCRIRDMNIQSVQAGLAALEMPIENPSVLHIELPRQYFDEARREWRIYDAGHQKLVEIDDELHLNGTKYILYSVIEINPQSWSSRFVPVIRPDGKRWYSFTYEDGDNRVRQLTEKEAVEQRAQKAYAAIYVRSDIAFRPTEISLPPKGQPTTVSAPENLSNNGDVPTKDVLELKQSSPSILNSNHETCLNGTIVKSTLPHLIIKGESNWQIPHFLLEERKQQEIAWSSPSDSDDNNVPPTLTGDDDDATVSLTIFISDCFKNHAGPGVVDIFEHEQAKQTGHVFELDVKMQDTIESVKKKALRHLGINELHSRNRSVIMSLDSSLPSVLHKDFMVDEKAEKSLVRQVLETAPERCLWLHVEQSTHCYAPNGDVTNHEVLSPPQDGPRLSPSESVQGWTITNGMDAHFRWQTSDPADETYYILVKEYNHETESLFGLGSLLLSRSDQIEKTIRSRLLDDTEAPLLFSIEDPPRRARKVDGKGTLRSEQIFNGDILIVQRVRKEWLYLDEDSPTVFINSPAYYLAYWWDSKNFPEHFSSQSHYEEENHFSIEGHYYAGQFARGVPHGYGRWINSDGDIYEGEFHRGYRHGKGNVVFHNGDRYSGEWLNDEMHGNGKVITSSSGNSYEGGFENGKRSGKGIAYLEKAEEEYASSARQCGVCYANEADAFFGCKHICMCVTCAKQCKNCPICRYEIGRVLKLEYSCLR